MLDPASPTPHELFLAAAIGAMIACGLTSFFLAGRVTERTHVALATLVVLIGGFSLFTLFGLTGRATPAAGALVLLGLIGLFKLMNQFEIRRKSGRLGH
jgi:CHASE2 domain-containing sensor protein